MNSEKKVMSAEQFLEYTRKPDVDVQCPYCGMKELPFQHYRFCTMGMDIEKLGYVVGWIDRIKEAHEQS